VKIEDEWAQWESDFRSPPKRTIDAALLDGLIKKSRRKTTLARVAEIGGPVFGFVTFGVLVTRFPAMWPLASVCMAGFFGMVLHALHVRRSAAKAAPTVAGYVALELDRKRMELRIHKVATVFQGAFTIAFGLWLPYFLMTTREAQGANVPWLVARLVFGAVMLSAVWLFLQHQGEKLRAEVTKFEAIARELSDAAPSGAANDTPDGATRG
jgi:uncharacterized membrane protein